MYKFIFRLFYITFIGIIITACSNLPEQPDDITSGADGVTPNILLLKQQYRRATKYYNNQLNQVEDPQLKTSIKLRLATSLAHIDQIHQSRNLLNSIDEQSLTHTQQKLYRLSKANIAIAERQATKVLDILKHRFEPNTDALLQAEFHVLRARAFTMSGNRLEAARERVEYEKFLQDKDLILENQKQIWELLANLSVRSLQHLITNPPPDELTGWMELVKIAKIYQLNPLNLKIQLTSWQQTFPDHPVLDSILNNLMQRKLEDVSVPDRIALLLPLSGNFAKASEAIKDGFLAAYYTQHGEHKQIIRIYDTTNPKQNFITTYQQAVKDGAQFIVGPLRKPLVQQLINEDVPVPTLALNYVDTDSDLPNNLYQFGLSPEEEARQVAERTWLDGYIQAAALVPAGPWGNRVFTAFKNRWTEIGGKIVGVQTYDPSKRDFSTSIRDLLEISSSRRRYRQLAITLKRKIKFTARRRQDVDFIFLAAYPRQARQIQPQLKFYHAENIPVYATSHVFTGNLNQERDRDMDGMFFGDMPWVLTESTARRGLRVDIESQISAAGNRLQRLYALGIDSFNIIPAITTLRNYSYERFDGETGSLSLDAKRHIRRQLTWVTFRSGRPVSIDNTNE